MHLYAIKQSVRTECEGWHSAFVRISKVPMFLFGFPRVFPATGTYRRYKHLKKAAEESRQTTKGDVPLTKN